MNPDIKKKWVKALRSGHYKQGRLYLKKYGYSCLGVLCDIYFKENGGSWKEPLDGPKECMGKMFTPPNKVLEWAGLDTRDPFITIDGEKLTICGFDHGWEARNIFSRKSFEELATAIEEQL